MTDSLIHILGYKQDLPLLFSRMEFWVFFLVVYLFFVFLYPRKSLRNAYLFVVSLFFYYKSGGYFFGLLILSTLVDYFLARLIHSARKKTVKKTGVVLSLTVNLGMLAYFKYAYFLTDLINRVFHTRYETLNILAAWTNAFSGSHFDVSLIILPVGISFFTFQTISYTLDVYRGKLAPVRNILDFGFYVSFFPQLVAGPIVRAATFIPQLYQDFKLSRQEFGHALFLILSGLGKKILIADFLSVHFIDRIFQDPTAYSGAENLLAFYAYPMQIYCDFSGYTDIAIGLALLMGFRLPLNFNVPYKASSLSDFWRRWHISLSSWLRDYLYIPLGGNRKGKFRTGLNLMITMLLGGLWHGAHIKYIVWGALHGTGLVVEKIFRSICRPSKRPGRFRKGLSVFFSFHFVAILWIIFRADNLETAGLMIRQIVMDTDMLRIPALLRGVLPVSVVLLFAYLIHYIPEAWKENIRGIFIRSSLWIKLLLTLILTGLILSFGSADVRPFIYFQF